jgi:hypothetical protein
MNDRASPSATSNHFLFYAHESSLRLKAFKLQVLGDSRTACGQRIFECLGR